MGVKYLGKTILLMNSDGSIHHLSVLPGELARTIILVGDPDRVPMVSQYFDSVELKKRKREFVTHTGYFKNQRLSVVSTGIGTDNIDIVMNECDAVHNIDFEKRCVKETITPLKFIRLGTCGGVHSSVSANTLVVSKAAVACDGLMHFYDYRPSLDEQNLLTVFKKYFKEYPAFSSAYVAAADPVLLSQVAPHCHSGITLTCPGFYAPQSRALRAPIVSQQFLFHAANFENEAGIIANVEMETAGIYALANLLGHAACSISVVLDNCVTDDLTDDGVNAVSHMIKTIFNLDVF